MVKLKLETFDHKWYGHAGSAECRKTKMSKCRTERWSSWL